MSETALSRDVTEPSFDAEVLETSRERGVVVDFWAPWCGPCHQLAPVLEGVAGSYVGRVDLVKVNVDEAPALARRYGVQGIPAVKAFRGGTVVAELTGVQPRSAIDRLFAAAAPSAADRLAAQATDADGQERERLLRAALQEDPGHVPSVLALARLLADRGQAAEARELLDRVPTDGEVTRLRAELNLADADADLDPVALDRLRAAARSGDAAARLRLGRALAASGEHVDALDHLLAAVKDPATRDEARAAVIEVFALLGDDHELVRAARPRLASALF